MGYTVYFRQASYNRFCDEFVNEVKKACDKYVSETNDTLDTYIENDCVKINSHNEGCEDLVINNQGAQEQWCKTARNKYTLIVKAVLLIAKKYDYVFSLSCDDSYNCDYNSWNEAKNFVNNL